MAEINTPGEARKHSLRQARWVLTGIAVGAAALLTGIVAGVNGSDRHPADRVSSSADAGLRSSAPFGGRYPAYGDDDEFDRFDDDRGAARPYVPQQPSWQPQSQPQTRSGGS